MDVSPFVFIPYFLTATAVGVGVPVALVRYGLWRRVAKRRISSGCCGRCHSSFTPDDERFLITGVHICSSCAIELRHRLGARLTWLASGVVLLATVAGGALLLDLAVDGRNALDWWSGQARWSAVLLPSVGIAALSWIVIASSKAANRLASGGTTSRIASGTTAALRAPDGD